MSTIDLSRASKAKTSNSVRMIIVLGSGMLNLYNHCFFADTDMLILVENGCSGACGKRFVGIR